MALIKHPYVIPAHMGHVDKMHPHMRAMDRKEVYASSGLTPEAALRHSFQHSPEVYSVFIGDNDIPALMFGISRITSLVSNKRVMWMLATDQINEISFKFLRESNSYIDLLGGGSRVYNYVLEGNDVTLKWLYWLGFTILKPKPYGLMGQNFHYAYKDTPCVRSHQEQPQ